MTAILQACGKVLLWIYNLFEGIGIPGSYVLALVLFTLITKIILFPLSYKGKKSMMKTTALQAKAKRLEAQYAKDKQRYQMELQKLYQKEGVNPMGGCLWTLLPLPVLIGLYSIIRQPLKYMLCLTEEQITAAITAVNNAGYTLGANAAYQELQVAGLLGDANVMSVVKSAVGDAAASLQAIDFRFIGIDLAQVPSWKFWQWENVSWGTIGLFLIPLAVAAINFVASKYSTKTNKFQSSLPQEGKKKKGEDPAADAADRTGKQMMIMMPVMYLIFGYSMPAGMCVYMAASAVFMMVQDKICSMMLRKKFLELEQKQLAAEEAEKEELRKKKEAIAERRRQQAEEAKANKSKKRPKVQPGTQSVNKAGRVGMRAHALGRAYDPNRYGGVTEYRDPQEIIDEQAVEAALAKKRRRRAEAVEDAMQQAVEYGDLDAVKRLEEEQAAIAAEEEAAGTFTGEEEETPALEAPAQEETTAPEGEEAPQETPAPDGDKDQE